MLALTCIKPICQGRRTTMKMVRRSLVIGDQLFTVWPDGIQSNELDTLQQTSWVPFD